MVFSRVIHLIGRLLERTKWLYFFSIEIRHAEKMFEFLLNAEL